MALVACQAIEHSPTVELFQQRILMYWQVHGRHDLPWRNTTDPWQLLIAEILLRKTTAIQAVEVYRVLGCMSPSEIAALDLQTLQAILRPLGLHEVRAIQISEIAHAIANLSAPPYASDDFLRSLKGIGQYISNSIRSCAFDHRAPALDTNMIRVLSRVFGLVSQRSRAREDKELWKIAGQLMPEHHAKEYNWGILDFAASVCTPKKPKCTQCPLSDICLYYKQNQPA
jgi:A/G-specific adenine glycosylase